MLQPIDASVALPSGAAGRSAVVRNARLQGLRCLHCAMRYPIALVHDGCAACRARGVYVSLCADYLPSDRPSDSAHNLPYTQGVTLSEGNTPLLNVSELAKLSGVAQLRMKDESRNPTGSHKDRMSAVGISQALEFGAHTVVLASSGNAAVSAAHYAKAAGLACEVATYEGMPSAYVAQLDA